MHHTSGQFTSYAQQQQQQQQQMFIGLVAPYHVMYCGPNTFKMGQGCQVLLVASWSGLKRSPPTAVKSSE
jgi:hypothetical protein